MEEDTCVPSAEALGFLQSANYFKPQKDTPEPNNNNKKKGRRRSKKPKQMKIQAAFRNLTKAPVNFQGMPIHKCTPAPSLDCRARIHPSRAKAWSKLTKQPHIHPKPSDSCQVCPDCFLQPCSATLLKTHLECDACTINDLIVMNEEERREKLRLCCRAQLALLQGKRFVSKQMPTNNDIPICAKKLTAQIAAAEAGGRDSLLEDCPFAGGRLASCPFTGCRRGSN